MWSFDVLPSLTNYVIVTDTHFVEEKGKRSNLRTRTRSRPSVFDVRDSCKQGKFEDYPRLIENLNTC